VDEKQQFSAHLRTQGAANRASAIRAAELKARVGEIRAWVSARLGLAPQNLDQRLALAEKVCTAYWEERLWGRADMDATRPLNNGVDDAWQAWRQCVENQGSEP
jgi:hypothetical protein